MKTTFVCLALLVSASVATAQTANYPLPVNLDRVSNAAALRKGSNGGPDFPLSSAQRQALARQGFVIAPAHWKQFHHVYEETRYRYQPVFVTTDSVLHIYHLTFDKLLRDLERQSLAPALNQLTDLLVSEASASYLQARGTALEADARTTLAYLAVAQQLAQPGKPIPPEVQAAVRGEVRLIMEAQGFRPSVVFEDPSDPTATIKDDYTQYIPRGHYARSKTLQQYFRAMMWLGRVNLRLKNDHETRVALITTRLLQRSPQAQTLWARLYDPTRFLVGDSDDLNYRQYAGIAQSVFGDDLLALSDPARLARFREQAAKLPPPQINSLWLTLRQQRGPDTAGFRLLGQRFTLDAYLLDQLTWRNVGTLERQRALPSALDVFAAFGSPVAYKALQQAGETRYANYDLQLNKLKAQVSAFDASTWTQNAYWAWLDVLRSAALPEQRDTRFPTFLRTPGWSRKELQSALGSYTELKHDTLLYAKQVLAEMGSGGEEPVHPRGYVEPNAAVYSKLRALTRQLRDGLAQRGVLSTTSKASLEELGRMLAFLQSVTERQLAGQALTEDENDRLFYYGGWLEEMTLRATDSEGGDPGGSPQFDEDAQSAVVADIATSAGGQVLTEATGPVYEVYAVVPNGKGGLQVARGGVYSYFEFTVPNQKRLTDAAWRAQINTGALPPQPRWLEGVIVR